MDDGYGPPTPEDDAWYQHHVVSKGYPKLRREPKQMAGQERIDFGIDQPDLVARNSIMVQWPIFRFTDDGPERIA